jgi:hypothetical protein
VNFIALQEVLRDLMPGVQPQVSEDERRLTEANALSAAAGRLHQALVNAEKPLRWMRLNAESGLPEFDPDAAPVGMAHLKDLMGAGRRASKQWLAHVRDIGAAHRAGVDPAKILMGWDTATECVPSNATAGPVTEQADAQRTAEPASAWIERAQSRAREIIAEQYERDFYPSQTNIADRIARERRDAGTIGAEGKPLTGAYIKRHALKGISSAKNRQLSTSSARGK